MLRPSPTTRRVESSQSSSLQQAPNDPTQEFDRKQIGQAIRWAFRSTTSREPEDSEIELLIHDFESYFVEFQNNPKTAEQLLRIGERKRDERLDAATLAAMTLVANTLLNLDESMSQN
jgi:hypothetical protein